MSSLETSGNPATQPFPSLSPNTTRSLSLVDTATLSSFGPTATASVTAIDANDIFQPIASDAPPPQITSRSDHPVPRAGILQQQQRLQTNKFYANLFLGDQTNAIWTHPYSLAWSAGGGQTNSYGMAISHIERNQIPGGPADESDRAEWGFFAAPLGIQSMVLSAAELTAGTTLTTDSLEAFSVNANLNAPGGNVPIITMPLVQGMGFITATYNSGTPLIQTGLGFESLKYIGNVQNGRTFKYSALLTGGFTWLIYVTPGSEEYSQNSFTLLDPTTIQGPSGFGGVIQVAKIPERNPNADTIYDACAGAYATGATISGSVQSTAGTYTLAWTKAGAMEQDLLMFALLHHVESFAYASANSLTNLQLVTTTKGMARAVRADAWTLTEPELPITMGFNPWSPTRGDISTLPQAAIEAINLAGDTELRESVANQSNGGSMYYDGKALAKFAAIVYTLHELADNVTLALTGLQQLQSAFDLHISNQQTFPLVYDTQWGGVVSVSTYLTGNNGDDFGNTYYNDHHFHFGYFVYAAAIIGYLDPAWLNQGTNRAYINALVRDYANSVPDDQYYPFSRNFDWFNGHSWAKGLFPSADGKDQESSSEDTMASLAVKMWGRTTNDKNMEARGNLMLAIQARSLRQYYLYTDDNYAQPPQFIGNKVAGILFDNKCDHTTYFGNAVEYIQGIHMLPLLPMSTLIRSPAFVQQEWDAYDLSNYAPTVQSGWRGVLMANLAIVDPAASYAFFSNASGEFQLSMLDGGASWTWYLAWSAGLLGEGA